MKTYIRRAVLLFCCGVVPALAGPLSVGVKAGVPLTDFLNTVQSQNFGFNSNTKRYIIGPSVQLNLPAGFAVEFDALYRRINYDAFVVGPGGVGTAQASANAWEFPLLLKYRFPTPVIKPFIDGGVAWDNLSSLKRTITSPFTGSSSEVNKSNIAGVVVGGGVDIHAVFLHIVPEIRYTRWGSTHFHDVVNDALNWNKNQAEFLLGITF
jgi:hypothetical protein